MSHLDPRAVASVLAGIASSETVAHLRSCEPCTASVRRAEMVASMTGASAPPPHLAAHEAEEDAARRALRDGDVTDPRVRTAGGVRVLLEQSAAARESDPERALELCLVAQVVLHDLQDSPPSLLRLLAEAARRERANALRYLGRYEEGLDALEQATLELEGVRTAAHEEARIAFTRATILWKMRQSFDEVRRLAREAAAVFADHGDTLREVHTLILLGGCAFVERDFASARAIYTTARERAAEVDDPATAVHLEENLAACALEMGDLNAASTHLSAAAGLLDFLGMEVEALRVDWNRGMLSLRRGQNTDGLARLRDAASGFLARGNAADAAMVTLDLAEHLAAAGQRAEAEIALRRLEPEALPPSIRVQIDMVCAAIRAGDARPAIRDARNQLRAYVSNHGP